MAKVELSYGRLKETFKNDGKDSEIQILMEKSSNGIPNITKDKSSSKNSR